MKPPPFDYERPADTTAALASLASHGGRAMVLAGGQSLLAMLNLRLVSPERLIDVSRLNELKYIRVAGNELRIGALTTHNTVLKSTEVTTHCPIIAEAYRHVSHHSVRNRGTIGGSLCHNDPAAEMPLVVDLLGASLMARSKNGERIIAADQFFRGNFETALEDDELLTEIRVPIPAKGRVSRASREYPRRATVREMKMLWGKRRGCGTFGAVQQTDGAPHVATF
jgi:aerobic carbon-monoxide dehydrogenase medium subunit